MTLFLIGLVLVLGTLLAATLLRGRVPPPVVEPPKPAAPPAPVAVAPSPTPAATYVRIRWTDAHGHVYGDTKIDKRARRPQMKHVVGKGREAVFVASHVEASGIWIYREVKGR